jgi:N-hydroxyarylamine O-acetyltransferase
MPGGDAVDFFDAWLAYGTGGTCWSGNGALYTLLLSLGFDAARGLCTMMVAPDIPPNHGSVLVAHDGSLYVVDASILHSEPLRLDPDAPSTIVHPAWGVQGERRDAQWYIRWRSMFNAEGLDCRFEQLSVTRDVFRERYEAARAWGVFNYELHFRLIRGEAIVGAARGERVEYDRSGACIRTPLDDEGRRRLLIEEMGIHEAIVQRLPADTPTPPPPWSQTAQNQSP